MSSEFQRTSSSQSASWSQLSLRPTCFGAQSDAVRKNLPASDLSGTATTAAAQSEKSVSTVRLLSLVSSAETM